MNIAVLLKSFINFIIGVVIIILGLRFVFRLFSANEQNSFVSWIYNSSAEIMGPFRGIFPTTDIEGSVFDFSALFAIFMYALIGFLAIYLIDIVSANTHSNNARRK